MNRTNYHQIFCSQKTWIVGIFIMILLTTAACSQNPGGENGFAGTQAALDLQSRQIAQKLVEDSNATQIALGVQEKSAAGDAPRRGDDLPAIETSG